MGMMSTSEAVVKIELMYAKYLEGFLAYGESTEGINLIVITLDTGHILPGLMSMDSYLTNLLNSRHFFPLLSNTYYLLVHLTLIPYHLPVSCFRILAKFPTDHHRETTSLSTSAIPSVIHKLVSSWSHANSVLSIP